MSNVVAIAASHDAEPAGFEAFWILYPRHVAKRDANKAWLQHVTLDLQVEVITATARWRKVWLQRGEIEFIPYPATWIRGWRWEDELPPEFKVSSAAHIPFTGSLDEPAKRTELPEAVKAMLRKLTGRA